MSRARATAAVLRPGRDRAAEHATYAEAHGAARVGLPGVLARLDRRGRRTWGALGLRVRGALTWDAADRRDRRWWPQGVSSSADARLEESAPDRVHGRRLLAVTWWGADATGRNTGSRLSLLDLDTRRYQHVDLVRVVTGEAGPAVAPLRVHAGGLVWHGPWWHVAATAAGLWTCHVDDVLEVEGRLLLPVRQAWAGVTEDGAEPFRWSFIGLSRSDGAPGLVAGEYARGRRTRRLVRLPLDPVSRLPGTGEDGLARASHAGEGVAGMQGAVEVGGAWHCTTSHGRAALGSLWSGDPGALRRSRLATPIGPEDLTWWPEQQRLWTVTEHPRRRWLAALRPPPA